MSSRQNYSHKREMIYRTICSTTTHPTAEWILQQLKGEYPDLSLGTVYRNLNRFKEQGKISVVGVVGGQERVDGNTHPHTHFICNRCGAVMDVECCQADSTLVSRVEQTHGIRVQSEQLLLYGLCRECSKNYYENLEE